MATLPIRNPKSQLQNSTRRHFLQAGAVGLGCATSGWFNALAAAGEKAPERKKSCILLWMNGGPSTIDLWDLKPGHENGGPFKAIKTNAPGLLFGEHLPGMADWGSRMAVLRGMSTKEGDHSRATYQMRTGNLPLGGIQYPGLGGLISKEIGDPKNALPNCVSIAPLRIFNVDSFGAGFLGPQYAPLVVADNVQQRAGQEVNVDDVLKVQNLTRPADVNKSHSDARLEMLKQMQEEYGSTRPSSIAASHQSAYDRATRLMQSDAGKVFDLSQEKPQERDRYGRNLFGQGCLLARRLVERGTRFIQIYSGGNHNDANWDAHGDLEKNHNYHAGNTDLPIAGLLKDLKRQGLLDSTIVVWGGEFGRQPTAEYANGSGRDHNSYAFTMWMAGGGIKGGTTVGKTDELGANPDGDKYHVKQLHATVLNQMGLDPNKLSYFYSGLDQKLVGVEGAQPIPGLV